MAVTNNGHVKRDFCRVLQNCVGDMNVVFFIFYFLVL